MKRRKFLETSLVLMGGFSLPDTSIGKGNSRSIRFGIVTDIHYAVKKPQINRYYKQSLDKLSECVDLMNKEKVKFLIELGDFKDEGDPPSEEQTLQFLDTIEKEFQRFNGPCYHVLGNHDEDSISKQQFLNRIKNDAFSEAKNYYSFEKESFQFIVLDANYTSENVSYDKGNFDWKDCHIPEKQLEWLKSKLQSSKLPTIIFIHQRLDSFRSLRNYCPDNSNNVRKILEDAGNVLAVFQGHDHRGGFNSINNIYYYTLKALIEGSGPENNSYTIVEISKDLQKDFIIRITGYRKAESLLLG